MRYGLGATGNVAPTRKTGRYPSHFHPSAQTRKFKASRAEVTGGLRIR